MMGRPASVALQLMIDCHGLDCTVDELAAETDAIFDHLLDDRLATMPGLIDCLPAGSTPAFPRRSPPAAGRISSHAYWPHLSWRRDSISS